MDELKYRDITKLVVAALAAIFVIATFCWTIGWLASQIKVEPTKCEEYPKYRYDEKAVPIECYKKYKGV